MTQHDVEVPVVVVVRHVDDVGVSSHADDVDQTVEPAETPIDLREHPLGIGALVRVARDRDAVDLAGDVGREVAVDVDAGDARTDRRQRVRRLTADALTGAEHDEAAAVEPQEPRVVGNDRVVGAGHDALTFASTTTPRRSSSGMSSAPSSSIVRMTDSCSRCPNWT